MTEELKANVNMDLLFPILFGPGNHPRVYIPWDFVAPHEAQAQRNHNQTLKRLKERGGLSPCELLAIIEDRDYRRMSDAEAWMSIWGHHRVFIRRPPSTELTQLVKAARDVAAHYAPMTCQIDALAAALVPFKEVE